MSSLPVPLRFVPTLTEVVQPGSVAPAFASSGSQPPPEEDFCWAMAEPLALPSDREALMVQRVLQRIDLVLEQRLQEVVAQLILEHAQTLVPRLREEIELVVRQSVAQAFEQEAAPAPASP